MRVCTAAPCAVAAKAVRAGAPSRRAVDAGPGGHIQVMRVQAPRQLADAVEWISVETGGAGLAVGRAGDTRFAGPVTRLAFFRG